MRKANKSKAATVLTSTDADSAAESADQSKAKHVAEQLEGADANRPPADPGAGQLPAQASFLSGATTVRDKEADAVPTGREQKKKREREPVAPAGDPQSFAERPGTANKKKHSSKVWPSSSVLGLRCHLIVHLHQSL